VQQTGASHEVPFLEFVVTRVFGLEVSFHSPSISPSTIDLTSGPTFGCGNIDLVGSARVTIAI